MEQKSLKTKEEIQERFPWMFQGDEVEPSYYERWPITLFGFETGDGWNNILYDLMEEIERVDKDKRTVIFQIKEKFGELRFYTEFRKGIDAVDARIIHNCISAATNLSWQRCEVCGEYGTRRPGRWINTLCKAHAPKAPGDPKGSDD